MSSGIFARLTLSFSTAREPGTPLEAHRRYDANEGCLRRHGAVTLRNFFLFVGAIALMSIRAPCCPPRCFCHSDYRAAACRLRPPGAQAVRTAQDTLAEASAYAAESLRPSASCSFGASPPLAAALAPPWRKPMPPRATLHVLARSSRSRHIPRLCQHRGRALVWRQDVLAGRMTGGLLSQFVLYAILARAP